MPFLDQSKIAMPKDETNYNSWADYFELFCLLNPDKKLSVESLKDRLMDENDNDPEKALKQILGVKKRINTPVVDLIADDEIDNEANDPETEQQIKTCIESVIMYMKKRKDVIPDFYPFSINHANEITAMQNDASTNSNKLYIILLLSSLIRVFQKKDGFAYKITHRFEELCRHPFNHMLPSGAHSIFFGSGGYINEGEAGAALQGSFYNKVVTIAEKLNLETTKLFTQDSAGQYNNGDGGLDWLGFFPFEDSLSTTLIFFAQCACGNDWEDKMFDANIDKWRLYITWLNDYQKIHFIPKSFRDLDNNWLSEISIYNCILVDRFRLIKLLEKSGKVDETIGLYSDVLDEVANTAIVFN